MKTISGGRQCRRCDAFDKDTSTCRIKPSNPIATSGTVDGYPVISPNSWCMKFTGKVSTTEGEDPFAVNPADIKKALNSKYQ